MVFPAPAAVHTVDHGQSGAGGPVPAGQLGGTLTVVQTADGPNVQFNAPGEEVVPLQCLSAAHLTGPNILVRVEHDAQRRVWRCFI